MSVVVKEHASRFPRPRRDTSAVAMTEPAKNLRIVVTGGNGGLGFEAVKAFAKQGAHVVLACRDRSKGEAAAREVEGDVEVRSLNLASLASVRAFAAELIAEAAGLDVLVNNAGVMAIPRTETEDGFEQQLGVNHLGHFALTALLWPLLRKSPAARVVTVSSTVHKIGAMRFDDLQSAQAYSAWGAYAQSKLANLLFSFELARRIQGAALGQRSVACHPGYAATNLQMVGPTQSGSKLMAKFMQLGNSWFAQSAQAGAWPTVFAALQDEAYNGSFIGPSGPFELAGAPKRVEASERAEDTRAAQRLWTESEALTGVSFAV